MNKALVIAGIWVIIFAGIIAINQYTLTTGEIVTLETQPVDPRDFLRGDYVILNYKISSLNQNTLLGDEFTPADQNQPVYVQLARAGEYAQATAIYKRPPTGLYIKGELKRIVGDNLNIEYGIESYFVEEGEGLVIERSQDVDVQVAIRNGDAVIRSVFVQGNKV